MNHIAAVLLGNGIECATLSARQTNLDRVFMARNPSVEKELESYLNHSPMNTRKDSPPL